MTDRIRDWDPDVIASRPTHFDPRVAEMIIEHVANGADVMTLCLSQRALPMPATFLSWVEQDRDLTIAYEQARRRRAELLFDQALEIADASDTRKARNQADVRQLHAERIAPDRYAPNASQRGMRPEEDPTDYQSSVRRKIEEIRRRRDQQNNGAARASS